MTPIETKKFVISDNRPQYIKDETLQEIKDLEACGWDYISTSHGTLPNTTIHTLVWYAENGVPIYPPNEEKS